MEVCGYLWLASPYFPLLLTRWNLGLYLRPGRRYRAANQNNGKITSKPCNPWRSGCCRTSTQITVEWSRDFGAGHRAPRYFVTASRQCFEKERTNSAKDVDPADSATENENVRVFDAAENSPATITSALQPSGRVVAVIRRNWKLFCGIIGESSAARASEGTSRGVFFLPVDRRIPRIRIRTRQAQSLIGKRIAVAIDGWLRTSKHPSGHFVRIIGDIGDRETETEVILLEHDVPYAPFSNDVLRCLPEDGERYTISASEVALREDLRALHVCSIDPPGCTDIDDALHCRVLPNGMYEVGVRKYRLADFRSALC